MKVALGGGGRRGGDDDTREVKGVKLVARACQRARKGGAARPRRIRCAIASAAASS